MGGFSVKREVKPPVAREMRRWWMREVRSRRERVERRERVVVGRGWAWSLWMEVLRPRKILGTGGSVVVVFVVVVSCRVAERERTMSRKILSAWASSSGFIMTGPWKTLIR